MSRPSALTLALVIAAGCGGSVDNKARSQGAGTADGGAQVPDDAARGVGAGGGPGAGGGSSASGGAVGSGGRDGAAGGATDAGLADAPVARGDGAPALVCGGSTCELEPSSQSTLAYPCCLGDGGGCGWAFNLQVPYLQGLYRSCQPYHQAGAEDPACSDITIGVGWGQTPVATFKGCCRPDGHCGAILDATWGCVDREAMDGIAVSCAP